jgi:hypothetical protein
MCWKSFGASGLAGNSLNSLFHSLLSDQNLQILGRIRQFWDFERENSLLNSLQQGIGSARFRFPNGHSS